MQSYETLTVVTLRVDKAGLVSEKLTVAGVVVTIALAAGVVHWLSRGK